jgi:hypothetical protein
MLAQFGLVPRTAPDVNDPLSLRSWAEGVRAEIVQRLNAARRERDSRLAGFFLRELEVLAEVYVRTLDRIDPKRAAELMRKPLMPEMDQEGANPSPGGAAESRLDLDSLKLPPTILPAPGTRATPPRSGHR